MSAKRTFTIQGSDIGYIGGHYKAASPYNAAKKAAKQLFRLMQKEHKYSKHKNDTKVKLLLRETTMGSEKKTFYYEGMIVKLATPKVITRNGVDITIEKEIKIKSCHDNMVTVRTPHA